MEKHVQYSFVDVGHLINGYNAFVEKWAGTGKYGLFDFRNLVGRHESEKFFFYDAAEVIRKEGESDDEFKIRSQRSDDRFSSITAIPNCHLNLGKLVLSGKRRRQKGVDIWLAVDAMNHAYNKNCKRIKIFAGDADFVPLVDALIRLGIIVEVIGLNESLSMDLANAADNSIELYNWDLIALTAGLSRTDLDFPSIQLNGLMHLPNEGTLHTRVTSSFGDLGIYTLTDGRFGVKITRRPNETLCVALHKNVDMLLKFLVMSVPGISL